mmetsp:Transcript_1013/g.1851  ORF Transcript_1013/g.1851 Transcript_1013/m.1851 type:complete len:85 (-) Transcript_1013:369-623(-)
MLRGVVQPQPQLVEQQKNQHVVYTAQRSAAVPGEWYVYPNKDGSHMKRDAKFRVPSFWSKAGMHPIHIPQGTVLQTHIGKRPYG